MMFTAPAAPSTAIWEEGHAKFRSAPMALEPITMYAPPNALRNTTVTIGTCALA